MRATLGLNGLIKYLQNLVAITFLRLSKAYLALCQASIMEKFFLQKTLSQIFYRVLTTPLLTFEI